MSQEHSEQMVTGHVTIRKYLSGFILALLLTVISFALVMTGSFSKTVIYAGLGVAAIAQMLVHLHYFLHLDRSASQRWNVIALAFTAILLFIFIAGTIWVMVTLNSRMM